MLLDWFNVFGLIFITIIMIPNVIYVFSNKGAFENKYQNRIIECIEQIGRFGCFCSMIFNIPTTWFGWWSDEAFAIYLIVDALLIVLYCTTWILCWHKNNVFKALALSIIPSVMFLFSGIMCRSLLLIVSSLLFAPTHIFISYKNAN